MLNWWLPGCSIRRVKHGPVTEPMVCVCVGGGGTLIFSYIRRLGSFFLVQNFEFQYL